MRNPLSMFRRHQKVLLAVFGVVIVITFTIGGSIEYYQSSRVTSGVDSDVVSLGSTGGSAKTTCT
jgi:hypothetical protein